MIEINLNNIEKIIFENQAIRQEFPEFRPHFDQWLLAKQHSYLRHMGKQAVLNLLNSINSSQLERLGLILKDNITLNRLENFVVKNIQFNIQNCFKEEDIPKDAQICAYRSGDQVYISLLR